MEAEFEEVHYEKGGKVSPSRRIVRGTIRRDSLGRVRTDYSLQFGEGILLPMASIFDPIKGAAFALDLTTKTVSRAPLPPQPLSPEEDKGSWAFMGFRLLSNVPFETRRIEGLTCRGFLVETLEKDYASRGKGEIWISEELNQIVQEHFSSPQGEWTWRLSNVRRIEPKSDLFIVPSEYTDRGGGVGR